MPKGGVAMTITGQPSIERLVEFNIARDSLRHVYLLVTSQRDKEPPNNKLVSLCHLVFQSLTLLDSMLDDEECTVAMAKGDFKRSSEDVEAIRKVFGITEVTA
jgi:hypothetical protein